MLDINKIIQESVQDTIDSSKPDIETLEENTNIDSNSKSLEEGVSVSMLQESYDPALASAISAGLGALNFRNHVRTINEASKLKKAGKAGAGIGAAGAAGFGGKMAYDADKKKLTDIGKNAYDNRARTKVFGDMITDKKMPTEDEYLKKGVQATKNFFANKNPESSGEHLTKVGKKVAKNLYKKITD
jgi:hypothetical protein